MINTKRKLLVLFLMVALVASACSDSSTDDNDAAAGADGGSGRRVTLVLDWTPNTNHNGIYLAEAEGFYDDAGIDLEIIQPGDAGSLQALGTGNAEFAISVQEQLIPAREAEVPVVSIAAVIEHNTSSLMALTSSGISSPADLVGHKYGGFGGQLETEIIDRLVACDGGDPTEVDHVEVGNVDARVGMENGDFDFVWIFDGWTKIQMEQEGVDIVTVPFIDHLDCIPDWYTPLIATSETLIADDPDLVSDFMDATARGYQDAISNPDAAADALLAAAPELDEDLVRASSAYLSEQFASEPAAWGRQDADTWTEFSTFLVDAELIQNEIDVDAAYTNDFLPEG